MTTLDQIEDPWDPIHLLLIADTKMGKSTYVAEAAIDGFNVIYIDSDNGLSAVKHATKNHLDARKRIHYLPTRRPLNFIKGFLKSKTSKPFFWNKTRNMENTPNLLNADPTDTVWKLDITQIPIDWILVIDGWTSMSADALGIGDADQKAELLNGTDQGIYGEANSNLTYVANLLQKLPNHVIVQAHDTKYEVYEKPTGQVASSIKQGQMTLRETLDVPLSSSRPHGKLMATRFNHIGWLSVNALGQTILDFTRKPNRVGGGPPDKKADTKELAFSKLAKAPPADLQIAMSANWYAEMNREAALEASKATATGIGKLALAKPIVKGPPVKV